MIHDVDEVLRKLLTEEMSIKKNDVDIVFDQPKREWSARLSKPTLNLFLFDIHENLTLRTAEAYETISRPDGTSEIKRNPVRMDLRYLMTAWVKEAEDEHLLLSSALMALLRYPFLPKHLLSDVFNNQPAPIPLIVGTHTEKKGPDDKHSELWGVLDNELRPGIPVTVTVAMDPYKPVIAKQVLTRELRFMQDNAIGTSSSPTSTKEASKTYWGFGGTISSKKHNLSTLSLILVEKNLTLEIDEDGTFSTTGIEEGEYTLDVLFNEKVLKRHKVTVPSPNYDVEV